MDQPGTASPGDRAKEKRQRGLERLLHRLDGRMRDLSRRANRMAWARLTAFVGGVALSLAALAWGGIWLSSAAAVLALGVFVALARIHNSIKLAQKRHTIWQQIKRAHLARMRVAWDDLPPPALAQPRPEVPLERDLDLTGPRSLHHLVDTCASVKGSQRLRDWLAASDPDPVQTNHRQALVRELVSLVVFRDKLRLAVIHSRRDRLPRWDERRLLGWLAEPPPIPHLDRWFGILVALAGLNALLFVLSTLAGLPPLWRGSLLIYAALYLVNVQRGDPFGQALALRDPLSDLQAVFNHLEGWHYRPGSALHTFCAPFQDAQQRPSRELARVTRVLSLASIRHNPWIWVFVSAVFPWDLYVMRLLYRRRAALAAHLPGWLARWYDLEALSALANLAYLNPAYTFPVVRTEPDAAAPLVSGRALGHPLIPDDERVCNDFSLAAGELALITGSNMSGKSTFLRTLGVNLALATAGGPVVAHTMTVQPLRLFTAIRVTDSVTDGISYFYAEVKRLRALLDALHTGEHTPLLYLIDEIFRGTNNRERLVGSRAYIRALAGGPGAGLLSTHDLELVQLADEIGTIRNYHFSETIQADRMVFDYTLRPGPSPTTNALRIMALEGLPVAADAVAQSTPRETGTPGRA